MKGYHKVKVFQKTAGEALTLPEGWKPFSTYGGTRGAPLFIVCRKWVRSEEE